MYRVDPRRFDELVEDAMQSLPGNLSKAIDNVAVVVEDRPPPRPLFGLYQGVPLTKRSPLSYHGATPDQITIFSWTISAYSNSEAELAALVRKTVIHEFAHHFGIDDDRLLELGWA